MHIPSLTASAAAFLWLALAARLPAAEEKAKDPTPYVNQAITAMRAQQWDAASGAWEKVLTGDPTNPAALSNLGKVQFQLGKHEAARQSLEKATALKPELIDSWLTLGQVYLELKAPMMAISATTRGVAENPADARSHNALAVVLKRVGWTNGAEAELQKALDLDPGYSEAHFNLAVMYLERKPPSLEMAGRHYRKALALGATPDELVEKQIRGESEIEEKDQPDPEEEVASTASETARPVPDFVEKPDVNAPQKAVPVPVKELKKLPRKPASKNSNPSPRKSSAT